ncbi:MAG: hypothetical protein HKN42_12310 [Granulosicoccus sp.]|nr:hypothetical protein [Granulosicoccus sp.]
MVGYGLLGLGCLLVGYLLGTRRARLVRRRVQKELDSKCLALLESRASLRALQQIASQQSRKDRLLKLTLRKLKQANERDRDMSRHLARQKRIHHAKLSRIRPRVVDTPNWKSCRTAEALSSSGAVKRRSGAAGEVAASVTDRESARLSNLGSSNEPRAFSR